MTEHTPGPWILHKYPGHVEAKNGLACCRHDSIIANTLGHSCNAPELQAEQEANARLIAASPLLLAAAKAASNYTIYHAEICPEPQTCPEVLAHEQLLAAIAKAEEEVESWQSN
jgi:hypothetical protein